MADKKNKGSMSDLELAHEQVELSSLKPHPKNYRKHPEDQLAHIEASVIEHGIYRPIVIANDGTILAGHGLAEAARRLDVARVPVVRLPIGPDDPRALKLLAGDNEIGRLAEVDDRALTDLLKSLGEVDASALLGTGFDEQMLATLDALAGEDEASGENNWSTAKKSSIEYTRRIESPVYRPTGERPELADLCDATKTRSLTEEIDASDGLSDDERAFLRLAAHRHEVFDYQKIAEFYAHASVETQALMEKSALVIIDFNKAIEYGFVKLSKDLAEDYAKSA